MSYSLGWSRKHSRWIGYGVDCKCEHPDCSKEVDRGMGCLCTKCRLAFCGDHLNCNYKCVQCDEGLMPFSPKPEPAHWLEHLRNDESWAEWRSKPKNMQQLEAWERAAQAAKGERDAT